MEQAKLHTLAISAAKARLLGMDMVHTAASGHIGGALSAMDLLTVLYFHEMRIDPANPKDPGRDRFILSKGHCTPALYAVLALRGYFPQEQLKLFRSIEGHFSGHPDMVNVPGVDMSTGSLGQGLSAAAGLALAGKMDKKDYRVYALLGDGELAEGQIWEAAMFAAHYKLDNLCIIADINGLQIDGRTCDVMNTEPVDAKFAAFGCDVVKINGHDFEEIESAFAKFHANKGSDKPTVILMKTTKGKGVSYMEDNAGWHGKAPNDEEYAKGMAELAAARAALEV